MSTRLLLVEDNACVRGSFTRLFSRMSVDVIACESAEDAEEHLQQGDVDVVLLDCRLPGKTGPELGAEFSARWRHIRVILMSAEDGFRRVAWEKCPSAPFLRKPIEPERLIAIVTGAAPARAI